jgi:hypothetical protein
MANRMDGEEDDGRSSSLVGFLIDWRTVEFFCGNWDDFCMVIVTRIFRINNL